MRVRRAIGMVLTILVGCSDGSRIHDNDTIDDEESIAVDALSAPLATEPLRFARACESGSRVTIAAVGDIMGHAALQRQAYARGWSSLWSGVTKFLDDADITMGNLETPLAHGIAQDLSLVPDPGPVYEDRVYSDPPLTNTHRSIASALRAASFDFVSTGNNHALDRGALGIDRTLDALDAAGLRHSGTLRSGTTGPLSARLLRNSSDFRIVGCSYSTNGFVDSTDQVLHCYQETPRLVATVSALARRSDIAGVVVTPHWGTVYSDTPDEKQRAFARKVLDAGAIAVIGHHSHVLQPWEKYVTKDGRETFIIYSLGNFVSKHKVNTVARSSSILLYVGLTRAANGKAFVNGVRYMPIYTRFTDRYSVVALDEVGGFPESRTHSTSIFGEWNVRKPTQLLDTTPECD